MPAKYSTWLRKMQLTPHLLTLCPTHTHTHAHARAHTHTHTHEALDLLPPSTCRQVQRSKLRWTPNRTHEECRFLSQNYASGTSHPVRILAHWWKHLDPSFTTLTRSAAKDQEASNQHDEEAAQPLDNAAGGQRRSFGAGNEEHLTMIMRPRQDEQKVRVPSTELLVDPLGVSDLTVCCLNHAHDFCSERFV